MCSEFHFHIYPRWNQDTPKVIKLQENFVFPHEQLLTFEQEDFILGRRNLISPRSSRLSSLCNYLQCCGTKFIWINTSKHKTRFPIIYFKQFVWPPSWRCMRKLLNLLLLEVDFHWTSKAYMDRWSTVVNSLRANIFPWRVKLPGFRQNDTDKYGIPHINVNFNLRCVLLSEKKTSVRSVGHYWV